MKASALLIASTFACAGLALPQASQADKKALVVGIDAYANLPKLSTAVKDASAVAKALQAANFAVVTLSEATVPHFADKWREFVDSLRAGDIAAFYFAGHGLQVDGANYLVLKDTPGVDAGGAAILQGSLNFYELMEQLEARQVAATLYILDACRVSPLKFTGAKASLGQARGLARIESVYGAFVMYSAGPDEEALDFLADAGKEANSVYARRLLPLLANKDLSLIEIAKRVQVQVEEDARAVGHKQRPAYFDGIIGQYYLNQVQPSGKPLGPAERIAGNSIVRLGGFATWDDNCQSRPAPRITAATAPRYGRVVTRYEAFTIAGKHFGGASCDGSAQKGVGVYYVIDDAYKESTAIESIAFTVKHWSVSPSATMSESYDVDLATKYAKRIVGR
jgi:hypothetical protein